MCDKNTRSPGQGTFEYAFINNFLTNKCIQCAERIIEQDDIGLRIRCPSQRDTSLGREKER